MSLRETKLSISSALGPMNFVVPRNMIAVVPIAAVVLLVTQAPRYLLQSVSEGTGEMGTLSGWQKY